ncbi:MAG: ABC transporter ATP-binding protein [Candidatus Kapaibacterium sp.]|jgi:Cu-processing system ATP-binding protein|nr:ABC transporter ATP-binding protein [Candidatus Kapabacteria bacterium]
MIRFKNISKSFGSNQVLKNVNIDLSPSSINAFLGPNGSGKTTLIKILLGLVRPDSGDIFYEDRSIINDFEFKKNIGYMTQIANYPENLTAGDLLSLVQKIRACEPVFKDELLERFQVNDSLNKPLKHLSGGTKQKVNVVLSLMFDSPIIVLDEPSVGLDPQSVKLLKEYIINEKKRGKTILMTSHIIQDVNELSDNLNVLIEGNIVYSGGREMILQNTNSTSLEDAIINIYTSGTSC